jgi:NADH:ubiquinone reductase (H+-translocating)
MSVNLEPDSLPPRVVVIGGGFGGIRVVRALRRARAEVVLFDRRNYHLFQPLLYQVATASLTPSQIAIPLRLGVERQANCEVFMSDVSGIDLSRNLVHVGASRTEFLYDYLVVAAGCETNYFGKPEWESRAPGLKSLEDALTLRQKFLLAFERAEMQRDISKSLGQRAWPEVPSPSCSTPLSTPRAGSRSLPI